MLSLKGIVKKYVTGDTTVTALKGVSLDFRRSEFVSILGPSGCGKTTLLNIIGGLDRYDEGELSIKGRPTSYFKSKDWDSYRNHSIGFVFQSYNLIPHQSVLSNVELALTLSGVSKSERRARAKAALEKVGLGDQLHKKPNQMSGGQMQRVAIARALVNDPEIILADEPTGALDSVTSVQIMEILNSISKEKLIIMVTHNPELAEEYSSRIIRLSDGQVTGDSNPYSSAADAQPEAPAEAAVKTKDKKAKKEKTSMSFATALSLSLNNLMTKKARTFLTSFAGSIGIIGIALILSLSNGIQLYINRVQEDTLSTYPLTINKSTSDYSALLGAMTEIKETMENQTDPNLIYVDDSMGTMMSAMSSSVTNNLEKFKGYIDDHYDQIKDYVSAIQYTYDLDMNVYSGDGKTQVNPTTIFQSMGSAFAGMGELMQMSSSMSGTNRMSLLSEIIDNQTLLDQQYDVVAGAWPKEANEVVLVISENNRISKMTLYMLGVLDQGEIEEIMNKLMTSGEYDTTPLDPYTFDDFLNLKFRLLNTYDFYEKTGATFTVDGEEYPIWRDVRDDLIGYDQEKFTTENGIELKISGIIRQKETATATSITTPIGYTKALTDLLLAQNAESELIAEQKALPDYNVLTGLKFERTIYTKENIDKLIATINTATMESLYGFMTEQIRTAFVENPPVNAETFLLFAAMLDADQQSVLFSKMLDAAKQNPENEIPLQRLCGVLTTMNPSITVTPDNLITLLPIFSPEQIAVAISGTHSYGDLTVEIKGLSALCGETVMSGIYSYMNEQMQQMTVDESNFNQLLKMLDDEQFNTLQDTLYSIAPQTDATLESNLELFGDAEKAKPASINFYAVDFESKEKLEDFISAYNDSVDEADRMNYTDMVGLLMSSVSTIINFVSYALIAFVSISLVVSSIMIGIITYISVLERTKEIGILRAIGASKKDISRVFNAETFIVGLAAGLIGILMCVLLCFPINLIIKSLADVSNIAVLPWLGGVILVGISVLLTLIAGLIPAKIAAKKDPVIALRSE